MDQRVQVRRAALHRTAQGSGQPSAGKGWRRATRHDAVAGAEPVGRQKPKLKLPSSRELKTEAAGTMRIAREGFPFIFTGAALTVAGAAAGCKSAAGILGMATIAAAAFFRDPERRIPTEEGVV